MKFYKVEIVFYGRKNKIIKYPKGKEFENFDCFFDKYKSNKPIIQYIHGYNKQGFNIYTDFQYLSGIKRIYNDDGQEILRQRDYGNTIYPQGKEAYNEYINQLKKEKLEKILKS